MSASRSLAGALVLLGAACDDPSAPLRSPDVDDRLAVVGILHADSATQPVMVLPIGPGQLLPALTVVVTEGSDTVASEVLSGPPPSTERRPCADRYGTIVFTSQLRCIVLGFTPAHGVEYRIEVSAPDRETLSGVTRVPAAFHIVEAAFEGDPPGVEGLDVTWTRSTHAGAYIVALVPEVAPDCVQSQECAGGWFATTTDTVVQARVDDGEVDASWGPWQLHVLAASPELRRYLASGTIEPLLTIAPATNISGGHGIWGAWTRRTIAAD